MNNKNNGTIQLDADTVAVIQEPGKHIIPGTSYCALQGKENVWDDYIAILWYIDIKCASQISPKNSFQNAC